MSDFKPDVYSYNNYQSYLKDYFQFLKISAPRQTSFSLRNIARRSGLSVSLISLILAGKRKLKTKQLDKLQNIMKLSEREFNYLKALIDLCDRSDTDKKEQAFKKMTRFRKYKTEHPNNVLAHKYLANWQNVAIREMSNLADFQDDAKWIQRRLLFPVPISQIKDSLEFLKQNGLINIKNIEQNKAQNMIDCTADVYRLAMGKYYQSVLSFAAQSIQIVPREQRNLLGFTVTLSEEDFQEVKQIMNEALERIKSKERKNTSKENVYQFSFLSFPLTNHLENKANKKEPNFEA